MISSDPEGLCKDFLSLMGSDDTRRAYQSDLITFFRWLRERKASFKEPFKAPSLVSDFVNAQRNSHINFKNKLQGISKSTMGRRIAAMRAFYAWFIEVRNLSVKNPVHPASHYLGTRWKPNCLPRPVTKSTVKRFLRSITNKRDRIMFQLYYDTGARLSELIQLDERDIMISQTPDSRELFATAILKGKGNKERKIFFSHKHVVSLSEYIAGKPQGSDKALFVNQNGMRITRIGVEKRFHFWHEKSGCKPFTPHQLRHSFATRCIRNGIPPEILKKLLGHSNLNTTFQYVEVDQSKTRDWFLKAVRKEEKNHAARRKKGIQ